MHGELTLSAATLISFAVVLSRIVGVFVFVPMPVQDSGPGVTRIVMALACTLALFPRWPSMQVNEVTVGTLTLWMISELALGTAIGLMVSFISECLTFGAQVLSLQAGYGYASVVDPTTQADSNVLPVLAQLMSGLLFFSTGLHRSVILAFANSLETYPPGQFAIDQSLSTKVVQLGASVFSAGLRLAMPVIALLLMTDLALGVVSRVNSQLQMASNAFPAKMLLTLGMLATILAVAPRIYEGLAGEVFRTVREILTR